MNQIAIDGLAGSGKSSIGQMLAKEINWFFLPSGKIYRSIAAAYWVEQQHNLSKNLHPISIINFVKHLKIDFQDGYVLINGARSALIFDERINETLKMIAATEYTHKFVNKWIRQYAKNINIIVEGRDIGSETFPHAFLKLYIKASLKVRTQRRYLQQKGSRKITQAEVRKELQKRDYEDQHRQYSPLIALPDAIKITTTNLTLHEAVHKIINIFKEKYHV